MTEKETVKKEMNIHMNWGAISSAKGDNKYELIGRELRRVDYVYLSEILLRREQGSSHVLRVLDAQHGCQDGMPRPTTSGEYRLRPKRQYPLPLSKTVKEGQEYDYKPGETVTWKQQDYGKLPLAGIKGMSSKMLLRSEMEMIKRRGEGWKLQDNGKAKVDKHGLITVSYFDAVMLLNNHGYRTTASGDTVAVCERQELTPRQIRHRTKLNEVVLQTRRNWLYEEIPPWKDPANEEFFGLNVEESITSQEEQQMALEAQQNEQRLLATNAGRIGF
jgi:hypothetical protein